jgi:acyl-homoserine lactone synthase
MLHLIDETNRNEPLYADMLEQSYRIRHDIYVNWRGWKGLDRPDGREIDQFDNDDARYLVWGDGSEVVGGARFIPTTKPHLMSEVFPHLVTLGEIPRDPNIWELTRIFTSRGGKSRVNRRQVTLDVFAGMFEMAVEFRLKAISVVCDTFFLPRLLERGIDATPLGLPTPYPEGVCIAIVIPISVEQLLAARGNDCGRLLYNINVPSTQRIPVHADAVVHAH